MKKVPRFLRRFASLKNQRTRTEGMRHSRTLLLIGAPTQNQTPGALIYAVTKKTTTKRGSIDCLYYLPGSCWIVIIVPCQRHRRHFLSAHIVQKKLKPPHRQISPMHRRKRLGLERPSDFPSTHRLQTRQQMRQQTNRHLHRCFKHKLCLHFLGHRGIFDGLEVAGTNEHSLYFSRPNTREYESVWLSPSGSDLVTSTNACVLWVAARFSAKQEQAKARLHTKTKTEFAGLLR